MEDFTYWNLEFHNPGFLTYWPHKKIGGTYNCLSLFSGEKVIGFPTAEHEKKQGLDKNTSAHLLLLVYWKFERTNIVCTAANSIGKIEILVAD